MYSHDLELLHSTRSVTLSTVAGLSQAQCDFSPTVGKWSIGEVLDHLLLSEKTYRGEIARLIQLEKAGQTPVIRRSSSDLDFSIAFIPKPIIALADAPFALFNMFVPSSIRLFLVRRRLVPAQSATATTPRKGRSTTELREHLRVSLRETEALFEANSALNYRKMTFEHPLLGTNNVIELLRVVALHEQRHQDQISDVLSDKRFPRAA